MTRSAARAGLAVTLIIGTFASSACRDDPRPVAPPAASPRASAASAPAAPPSAASPAASAAAASAASREISSPTHLRTAKIPALEIQAPTGFEIVHDAEHRTVALRGTASDVRGVELHAVSLISDQPDVLALARAWIAGGSAGGRCGAVESVQVAGARAARARCVRTEREVIAWFAERSGRMVTNLTCVLPAGRARSSCDVAVASVRWVEPDEPHVARLR